MLQSVICLKSISYSEGFLCQRDNDSRSEDIAERADEAPVTVEAYRQKFITEQVKSRELQKAIANCAGPV